MNIYFGKKIPITTCQIFDNEKKEFVKATCYEYDCQDKSDIAEIKKLDDGWTYKQETLDNMKRKFTANKNGINSEIAIFSLENKDGGILGLCNAENKKRTMEVRFLESKQDGRHKYVGQTLLASIGKEMLKNKQQKNFIIKTAIASAYDFYEKTCGFMMDSIFNSDLIMGRIQTYKFIKQTQERTQCPIIDLKV